MPNYISSLQEQVCPDDILLSLAAKEGVDISSHEFAKFMDEIDPLSSFRQMFSYPKKKTLSRTDPDVVENENEDCIYLCGNSLGLKPKATDTSVMMQLNKWAETGVELHFEEPLPAALCDNYGREIFGRLLGANPNSVVLMNALTVNLHLLLISFYQPTKERFKILIEKGAFPSDRYSARSQALVRGYDPSEAVLEVSPRPNEAYIRTEDIIELIEKEGDTIAVICLSGVQYYTGQLFDIETITKAGQDKGCYVGWDLAHAVGNVQLYLDKWKVDFACWCNYKYLNGGAGCIGGAYVNKKHNRRKAHHLHGWWSNKPETRFQMQENCDLQEGVDGFRLSNPSPIMVACVMESLKIFDEARMDRIVQKQLLLTGYLEYLLDTCFGSESGDFPLIEILTPRDTKQRGSQLSLSFSISLKTVHKELQKRGVVCDIRLPNVMRIAPAPLYNSFCDIYRFIQELQCVLQTCKSETV